MIGVNECSQHRCGFKQEGYSHLDVYSSEKSA
ncbi:hypothetical protein VC_1705 [Vibrio cholerae O1 biovar El Tor str. N16961]|uniref:Uncharacterized protein n=2 Tax=Vibrio cholerae TaxID=666 RepID=Q9KRD7_VIBCH|nr:hypothetical protein VC_1705 [Vibrio cholerae O1 biovar El Tor str. N16961]ACP05954.1 hypothetical protein VCM66_1645 [Vibrio cholerae M66-2]